MEGYLLPFGVELAIFVMGGLFAGSFLNVVALSLDDWRRILVGRSACPQCKKTLRWFELIPLLSFALQRGNCRRCGRPISRQYVAVEISGAVLFGLTYWYLAPIYLWYQLLLLLVMLALWLVILLHDARTMMVPMELVGAAAIAALVFRLTLSSNAVLSGLLAAAVAGLFIAVLRLVATALLKKEAMGSADAHVAAAVGLAVGLPSVYAALLLAFLIGSVYGLLGVKLEHGQWQSKEVPFAPALLTAGIVSLYFGESIINWYFGFLL